MKTTKPTSVMAIVMGGPAGFAHATPALAAIRDQRRGQRMIVLTEAALGELALASPYCDGVITIDDWRNGRSFHAAVAAAKRENIELIFDLVGSVQVERFIAALKPGAPAFTGTLRGAKYPADLLAVSAMHPLDAAVARVAPAGVDVGPEPKPDVSWAATARRNAPSLQPEYFSLRQPFIVLVPGGSDGKDGPVWPVSQFAALAVQLVNRGVGVAVASQPEHRQSARAVVRACTQARDLAGRASLTQLCAIAVHAAGAMGHANSDLLHLIAAAGAPTIALTLSHDDACLAPRGRQVMALAAADRDNLTPEYAAEALGMFGRVDLLRASA